jgi:hypothetical protein
MSTTYFLKNYISGLREILLNTYLLAISYANYEKLNKYFYNQENKAHKAWVGSNKARIFK